MKKMHIICLLAVGMPYFSFSQGFTISGSNLIDANGNNFIMKGFAVPTAWFVGNVTPSIASIKTNTNVNCLRIVVTTGTADADWQNCVNACIANKIIPIVELHDVTCGTTASGVENMASWWASKASFLTQPSIAKYILINIANEWGDWSMANSSPTTWRDAYISSVATIRKAGINTTLIIDAPNCGQDIQTKTLKNYATAVLNSDTKKNCIFSIHMYCEWSTSGGSKIATDLPALKTAGIPVMVGEFGWQENNGSGGYCSIDASSIMCTSQTYGIGWLAWSWKGNGGTEAFLDLSNDWAGTSLTTWGNSVVNGTCGTKTGLVASVFNTTANPTPTVTLTSPTNNSSTCTGNSIAITATATISTGSISKVDFYDGTTLLGTDNSSPYAYTWNNASAGTHTVRAIATSVANVASTAATASLTVNAPTAIDPYMQVNGGTWTAQSDATVCAGNSVGIGPHPVSTTGWTWTGPTNFTSTAREIQLPNITTSQGGIYTATYKDANGCTSISTMTVKVSSSPVITITSPSNNSTVTSTDVLINTNVTGTGINSVQFYNGKTLLGQVSTSPYNFTWNNVSNGSYALSAIAKNANNCSDTAISKVTVSLVTSLDDLAVANSLTCFPNPFTNAITLEVKGLFEYEVYTLSGIKVLEGLDSDKATFGASLPVGMYLLKVRQNEVGQTLKIHKY